MVHILMVCGEMLGCSIRHSIRRLEGPGDAARLLRMFSNPDIKDVIAGVMDVDQKALVDWLCRLSSHRETSGKPTGMWGTIDDAGVILALCVIGVPPESTGFDLYIGYACVPAARHAGLVKAVVCEALRDASADTASNWTLASFMVPQNSGSIAIARHLGLERRDATDFVGPDMVIVMSGTLLSAAATAKTWETKSS